MQKDVTMKKRFYKVIEVAEILNVSKGTVYNLIKQKKIPYAKINMLNNTRYMIPIEQFEQFVQNNISYIEKCKEIT